MEGLAADAVAAEMLSREVTSGEIPDRGVGIDRGSELETTLEMQAKLVSQVEEMTSALGDKLAPVLGHVHPSEAQKPSGDSPFASNRAVTVFEHNERLAVVLYRLRELRDRLEV